MDYLAYIPGMINEITRILTSSSVGLAFLGLGVAGAVIAGFRRLLFG